MSVMLEIPNRVNLHRPYGDGRSSKSHALKGNGAQSIQTRDVDLEAIERAVRSSSVLTFCPQSWPTPIGRSISKSFADLANPLSKGRSIAPAG